MSEQQKEFELKIALTESELQQLRKKPALTRRTIGRAVTRRLRSIYFDTPDHMLRKSGIALRVRRVDSQWIQTVKFGTAVISGLSNPVEVEAVVEGPEPEPEAISDQVLRKAVRKAAKSGGLAPVFETDMWRTARRLKAPCGGEVELALDRGEIKTADLSTPICEAEIELKNGSPDAVFDLGELMFVEAPLRFSSASKAEQGYRAALGRETEPLAPLAIGKPSIRKKDTTEEAFRKLVGHCANVIAHNLQVVLESDASDGPHKLRIALRNLRAAIRAFGCVVDAEPLRELEAAAAALARLVGDLRDADVLLEDIVAPLSNCGGADTGYDALRETLLAHREHVRTRVRAELTASWISAFQFRLLACAEGREWLSDLDRKTLKALKAPVKQTARLALRKTWKRARKRGANPARMTVAERHRMRKALKTLRYTAELFSPLFSKRAVRRFTLDLKRLQNAFGYLNDIALAETLPAIAVEERVKNPDVHRAIGFTLGWHTANAERTWSEACARWDVLRRTPRFWT